MTNFGELLELYSCNACGKTGRLADQRKQIQHTDGNWYHPTCIPKPVCPDCFLTKPCECDE